MTRVSSREFQEIRGGEDIWQRWSRVGMRDDLEPKATSRCHQKLSCCRCCFCVRSGTSWAGRVYEQQACRIRLIIWCLIASFSINVEMVAPGNIIDSASKPQVVSRLFKTLVESGPPLCKFLLWKGKQATWSLLSHSQLVQIVSISDR